MKKALREVRDFIEAYELVPLLVILALIAWPFLSGG